MQDVANAIAIGNPTTTEGKKMKKWTALLVTGIVLISTLAAMAADRANDNDAVAMVKKASAHYKAAGASAYTDFTAPSQKFVDRDLYITAYDMDGNCLAHAQNIKLVGKNLMNMKDPDGVPFIKNRIELAKQNSTFWQDYKFTDPLTKEVLPKKVYCETVGATVICGGVYKQ